MLLLVLLVALVVLVVLAVLWVDCVVPSAPPPSKHPFV